MYTESEDYYNNYLLECTMGTYDYSSDRLMQFPHISCY